MASALIASGGAAHAVTEFWTPVTAGPFNWTLPANWGSGVPNAIGDIGIFGSNLTANQVVTMDAPITLGGLTVGDSLGTNTFTFAAAGGNPLTFEVASGSASIDKYNSTTDVFQAPLVLNSNLKANIFSGIFSVNNAGAQVPYTGTGDTIKNGAGALELNIDAVSGAGYTGNFALNLGTLRFGGANNLAPTSLGMGSGGIILNGTGNAALAVLELRNNGGGSNGVITYGGNNDVMLQGGATINVNSNFVGGANTGNTVVLDNLTANGGILAVTSANSYSLRFAGAISLVGDTTVFSVGNNSTFNLVNLDLAGVINDGPNNRALIKEGTGRMLVSNATASSNDYQGVTAIKDGILQVASGAELGSGAVIVNGGAIGLVSAGQVTDGTTMIGGLTLVSQVGTSRASLGAVVNTGFVIDGANPLGINVPIFGAALEVDTIANSIDMSQVGGAGNTRVYLGNRIGADSTYTGAITAATDATIRLTSGSNTLVLSTANQLGGAASTDALIVGVDQSNPLVFAGVNLTHGNGGTVSVRANNAATLGAVTVNRGVTLNINGTGLLTPVGAGVVTALGGTISTDATTNAQFGNTDFRLFGGSTLLLDNSAVTTANADRRLLNTTAIDLTSSTLRLLGDGGAATVSTQTVDSLDYAGGSTISVDTDGAVAGRLTTLTAGSLNRVGRATLNIRNIGGQATTFGTATGTQKLIVTTGAPTPTNDMIGANIALWGGTNSNDLTLPLFATYDATHGVQAASFDVTATTSALLAGATNLQIVDISGQTANLTVTTGNVQALRIRTTANTNQSVNTGTITIGSAAGVGQGAGLFLAHTADNEVTHTANFAFGTQEGLIYTAINGGSSFVRLNGNITGSNGVTTFGDGRLRLGGTNSFGGPLTINAGDVRLASANAAGLLTAATPTEINVWGGILSFGVASTRFNNNVTFFNDGRLSNDNVGSAAFNNLTVAARSGSTAPVVVWTQAVSGGNLMTAYGGLTLDGPARLYIAHPLQVNGAISGIGSLERFGNERLIIGGDSSAYAQPVTVNTGAIVSLNAGSTAKPFGTGAITINPGSTIRVAAPTNVNVGQVTVNSDLGGISGIAMTYVGDPAGIPATINSTAPWKGYLGVSASGFSYNLNQSSAGLWGGGVYLGAPLGDTGTYTGTLTPNDSNQYLLGTGQGGIRIANPLTGTASAVIGVSMTGDVGRADQVVNNSGGAVNYDVPMTYAGTTTIHSNISLRAAANNALNGTGDIILNGGFLRGDVAVGQIRALKPITVSNAIVMTADSNIQFDDAATDFRLGGNISLAPGSTGVVRVLNVNVGQGGGAANNAGLLYLDGGISDGVGGSGNHFVKGGLGVAMVTGPMTYTGTTTVTGGFLGVNGDADLANSSQIILSGGGLGIYENSFTTNRNVTFTGGNGWLDVAGGLTLTQSASSTFDGVNFIMKRGLGTVILNGNNAQLGLYVADGILQVNSQASLGDAAGTTATQFGNDQALGGTGTGTRYTGGTLRINATMATNRGLTFNNNGNTNFSGGVDVTGSNVFTVNGAMTQGTENDFGFKTGTGTLITTGANTGRQYAFTNGAFQFGNNTPWTNSTATAADNTNIEMLGGTIRAVNVAANIALANAASTTNYNYGGGGHLRMESGAGFSVEFAGDNLVRVNQGTLVIETDGGTTLGGAGATNAARLLTTNAINSGLARASALTYDIFAPHLISADAAGVANFTTNDATTGITTFATPVGGLSGLNPTGVVDVTVAQLLSGNNSIYAFRTNVDVTGGTLRIGAIDNLREGGILINGSNTISSNLVFDPTSATAPGAGTVGEGLIYVKTGENAIVSGNVTSNALTKFGRGTLTLGSGTSVLSELSVQDGTLKIGSGGLTSRMNSELNVNAGATLDLNGNSIAVETIGANNRQVAGINVGGSITNTGGAASLGMAGPIASTFTGTLNGALKLVKAGTGVLTLDGFRASTPDAGNNTFTGGTDIYGVGTTGGINLDNATFALGGFGTIVQPEVNLNSGTLGLLFSNGNTGINGTNGQQFNNMVVKFGAEVGDGLTLNVRGPGLVNVNQGSVTSNGTFGQGNIMQVGMLNMSNTTLTLTGGSVYRLRVAGTTTIQGSQAAFQTNSDGPSGALELTGVVTGSGALTKLGDGTMRGIILSNPANDYSGGTNIVAGDVQVTSTTNALGTGAVRVFPDGTLRIAGNGSVDGSKLQVLSRVNALGAVALDDNFNPTVLTSSNFTSVYNTTLQISQPYFTQALNMAAIGDGRAFLGTAINAEAKYMAATLGAGVADAWNPGVGVYRLVGGSNNLGFDGVNNVLTGTSYAQVGPRNNMILGTITNGGNAVVIRNSNDYSGGTQVAEGVTLVVETGGSPVGETPLGSGAVEVYGTLTFQGSLGSAWKADASAGLGGATNTINLRPGGSVRLIDANSIASGGNVVAGNQGRWGNAIGIDLNGGSFRYDGALNWTSVETIGDVTARKGGQLQIFRNNTNSSAQLNVGDISRADRGVVTLNYNSGFLGTNLTTPLSYERITASTIGGLAISRAGTTTNGAGVGNPGMVAPWIVDRVTNSFVGYDPTGAGTGFQPLLGAAPGAGQIAYNKILTGALTAGGLVAGDIADLTTAAKTLADNPTVYALRTSQNLSPNASNNTLTISSGGLIVNTATATINPTAAGVVAPMTLNFGLAGAGEAFIYNSSTAVIQAQINAALGVTKFGAGQLQIHGINPGIGAPVVLHEGTTYVRVPYSLSGSPVGQVLNSQDVIVNGGTLNIQSFNANAAGTASEIASNVASSQALFDSNIYIRGDAALRANGSAQYVRISDLTVGNAVGATAMNANGVISLNLQSGIWVRGTTTLAPEAVLNSTFDGFSQSTLAGQVTGAGGIQKYGNGAITLLNPANNYAGPTTIWGTTIATAVSTVASAYRGTGTPFSTGDIVIQPGGLLRVADNANIASNAVHLRSDGYGLGGIGLAHNGALPTIITTGTPAAGEVRVESTGPFAGVISLDYGYYSQPLNMAAIPGGAWFLGNSQQAEAYYFNSTLGAAAGGKYLLGGGGNQSGVTIGSVLVSGGRTSLFEDVITGGSAGQVKVEIGAQTGDFAWNSPSFVNGNSGFIALTTRNLTLAGDVRVNTNTTLALGNNFALGSGRLIVNGGNIRADFGNNNFITTSITLNNDVVLQGDFNMASAGDLVLRGNVAMSDVLAAGATRNWNVNVGTLAVRGVVSGAQGSNLIKTGAASLVLTGANTYQGYTQVSAGTLFFGGDVKPNVAGPLGVSDSPVVMAGGSLRATGRQSFDRDLIVNASGTLDTAVHDRLLFNGGISIASTFTLTTGSAAADVTGFRGGLLEFAGPISGAGALTIGTTATAPAIGGTVLISGNSNGYGLNTYAGGTTLQSARLQIGADTYFSGPANNPTILSGPLGLGTLTFGAGEANRGGTIEAVGGARTIVNALGALSTAANTTLSFSGHEALTFTRNLDLNSENTAVRNRVFTINNVYQPVTFSGDLTSSAATVGVNFVKNGAGTLVLTGTNTQANILATDAANYGVGMFIDAGIVRVGADAALGRTTSLAAAGPHTIAGPADLRMRGGTLSISTGFTTARQLQFTVASGIDVASGETLTLSTRTSGAFGLTKTGPGTLALDNSANAITALVLGGVQQLNPNSGRFSHTGGTVSTTATSGTPLGTSATINSGTLTLSDAAAQTLNIPTITYGAAGKISIGAGDTLSASTGVVRGNLFNTLNYGTLTINPSGIAALGVGDKLTSAAAPANTAGTGGDVLTVPSVFVALAGAGQDANFTRYIAGNGFGEHNVTTVATLGVTASSNIADLISPDTVGAALGDVVNVLDVRTNSNIAPFDPTTSLQINLGGLIINGATASTLSANTLFGTGTAANQLVEAIAYVRDGQTGTSAISGNITARDFTKTGPGLLELSGTNNQLNASTVVATPNARQPVVSVQEGTLRYANAGAAFTNQFRGTTVGDSTGHYTLNVNETGTFDLNGLSLSLGGLVGNGTITSGVAGAATLTVKNGLGLDTNFSGGINNGAGTVSLTKSQNGVLTLSGHSTYSGGTRIEAGRVTNGVGSAVANGRLEAQTVGALGTGDVTLAGGTLRLNPVNLLNAAQTLTEVSNAIDYLQWGGSTGLNITVSNSAFSNGVALPANVSSTLSAATVNAGINNLTVNAPIVTFAEGLYQVNGITTFSETETVLRTAGGRLFLAGKIAAAGNTIIKTGANDVVLSNSASGAGQNDVGLWKIYGGLVEARTADGSSNPLGTNPTAELNVGTTADGRGLRLFTDGDGTGMGERVLTYADTNVRFGSSLPVSDSAFVSSGASRLQTDRAFIANNSFKTVEINNMEVNGALGTAYAYVVLGNNDSIWVDGTTTFQRDLRLQIDGGQGLTLNGLISGNGSFTRGSNGGSLYINADNSTGYSGGTFFTASGRNYLGSMEGNQVTLSTTAKLGAGHIFQGPLALFQINAAGNLQAGQNIYVSGNLSWMANFSLAADLSLDTIRLRSAGLGGIQNGPTDYYLSASNPSMAVLSLGTVYTQALDMSAIGDGMWYLGSVTNGVGANGVYNAATLGAGLGNTYRLGAGGSALFFGTNGNANVLTDKFTDSGALAANLIVGTPMTVQNFGPVSSGSGTVVLLQNQNYTGSTLVNTGSTLDFRGTLQTSGFEAYGVLNVAGEAGTFVGAGPVTLRPGSTLRFDNTAAGVLPTTATEGRWADATAIALNDSVLRLQGNAGVEVVETVGPITANNGGNRIEVVRGVIGRGTELRTPSITRGNFGTVQFSHNGSQLGSDERVITTLTAPTVTNGMVEPWMLSASDQQFVTYNGDTGFTIAGFDRVQGATTFTTLTDASTARTIANGTLTMNGGDFRTYALRLDTDANLTSASSATNTLNRLIVDSGGLIVQSSATRTIQTGLWAGATGTGELFVFNPGVLNVGILANNTTSGRIKASSITKNGAGTFQILSEQPDFSGDIRVQQGALQFQYTGTSATKISSVMGGVGGNIVLQGNNTSLILRIGNDSWTAPGGTFALNNNVVIGDYVPFATINYDRAGGTINGRRLILNNLTFGQNNGDNGQVLRVINPTNDNISLQFNGTTTLTGRSALSVENNYSGGTNDMFLMGQVTGSGMLIKGPSDSKTRNLLLQNVNSVNDWAGGTVLQGGTLQVLARANNVAANASSNIVAGGLGSASSITLMGGTLDLRVDSAATGAADTEIEFVRYTTGSGVGQDLNINGSTTINVDRNAYQGTYTKSAGVVTATVPGGHGFVNGQLVTIATGPNAITLAAPGVTVVDANTFTYTDSGTGTGTAGFFTVTNGSSSNKMLTFNNMNIGSQILTVSGGNGYGMAVAGTTTMLGNAFLNNGTELVLGAGATAGAANSLRSDGGQVLINKIGTGTLWIGSTNNDLTGPTYLNAGLLDWGNRQAANTTATLGSGNIYVNAGAQMRIRGAANINTGLGQKVVLTGTAYAPAVLRPVAGFTQAEYQSMLQSTTSTSNEVAIIAFEGGTLNQNLDQSTMGNGRMFFGNVGDRTLAGSGNGSITPGLANLPDSVVGGTSTNQVYRLGGGSANTLIINLAGSGNLTNIDPLGTNTPADVLIGSQAKLGPAGDLFTGFVYFQDQNTYTGQTVVSRGMNLRFNVGMAPGNTAGPLGANAGALIDVYGNLRTEAGSSLLDATNTSQFYTNVNFHPGGLLTIQDAAAAGNRWEDFTSVNLDGAGINVVGTSNINLSSETVGALNFDRGSRVFLTSQGTGDAILTALSANRAAASAGAGTGRGTLVFQPAAVSRLGLANTSSNAEQVVFVTAPTPSTSAVTGMLPGYYMDGQAHRFVTHDATNGITPVADGSMVPFTPGMTAGTAVVNVTGNVSLPDFNPVIYALRGGAFTLNSPTGANNDATITLGGGGADIGSVASFGAFVINPNLKFGASGTNEAIFYTGSTLTVNGTITAGSITKFGTGGTLVIANDQSDAARGTGQGYQGGWVVNEGAIQFGQFGSAGNADVNNTIVLNGARAGSAQLNLRAQPADSLLNYTYTSGRIIAVDNATIDWDPGASDRVHTIADLEIQQSGGIGNATANGTNDALLRVANNQFRSILAAGQLIVTNNAILNVDTTGTGSPFNAYGGNAAYLTNGLSSGMSVASLTGSERLTKWGDGYLYIRGASPSFSGSLVIDQGPVHVTHNQSLGTGPVTVNRYGVLDVGVANFAATNSSVTYNEGSIERWSVNNARSGTLNLGKATLQVAADQPTTDVDVTLNGGGIEAWIRNDDQISAQSSGGVLRVLNPNITFTLASDSYLGSQYYLGANGLDNGKQTHDNRPLEEYLASGALLEIKGVISGPGGLTKVGYDSVFLSGNNIYGGATKVEGGKLLIGTDNALPTTTTLTTTANGVLDLNGQNQTVGKLSNPVIVTTANSSSGFITNSGTSVKTLTVGNGSLGDATYSGVIQHNVGLTKTGTSNQTLTNANTYVGPTTVEEGILSISGSINGTSNLQIDGGSLLLTGTTGLQVNDNAPVTLNGGTLGFGTGANHTETLGSLSLSLASTIDFGGGIDQINFASFLTRTGGATLSIMNWAGTAFEASPLGGTTGVDDRLIFGGNKNDFISQFSQADVTFNDWTPGYAAIDIPGGYEIVAVPEPSSTILLGSAGLLALLGYRDRRRSRRALESKRS